MMVRALIHTQRRLRPREGWLSFTLLLAALGCVVMGVQEVNWVSEDSVVTLTAVSGFLLALVLAKRPLSTFTAWVFLTLYGLLIPILTLAQLWYVPTLWGQPWQLVRQTWLNNGALFWDRSASWVEAALNGGSSEETIIFALALGLLGWLLGAYLAWSSYRQQRPLLGLTIVGLAATLNSYYGNAPIYWLAFYFALAAVATAVMHFSQLQDDWTQRQVDYAADIFSELALYASGIALLLLILALALPALPSTKIANDILVAIGAREAEETVGRVFAGINQPRTPGSLGGSGTLPRGYLLTGEPELLQTVVMTATVTLPDGSLPDPALLQGLHWRGLSYVTYTGRGWTLSEEREEPIAANQPIPLAAAAAQRPLQQQVHWLLDTRTLRYTIGLPTSFDQDVRVAWRGLQDLSRVFSDAGPMYQATTHVSAATAVALRQTTLADVPPVILARYTQLPTDLPPRIAELAAEITAGLDNPYDQARALEQFLHQYRYTLDLSPPPPDRDPVDYFLFELQRGYCDYYASSMVVMARTLGLPARIAIGYLPQPADANGTQTVRHENGHSWAEVYFAGYGWVEFEPTAPFAAAAEFSLTMPASQADGDIAYEPSYPETALPEPDVPLLRRLPWVRLGLVAGLALLLVTVWWWQRQQWQATADLPDAVWVYGRLQQAAHRLGQPTPASQTPHEFQAAFANRLAQLAAIPWRGQKWVMGLVTAVTPLLTQLTDTYTRHQYRPQSNLDPTNTPAPHQQWQQIQPLLRRLRLLYRWLSRKKDTPSNSP